jgi:hypothetical protein
MSNLVRTWMLLERLEVTNSANVVSSSNHDGGSWLELDHTTDALGGKVELYSQNRV